MSRYDLDFEDDGASWRVRRERQLKDMIRNAHRARSRPVRLIKVMMIPPAICGAVFLIFVVAAIVAAIAGAQEKIDPTPYVTGDHVACLTRAEFVEFIVGASNHAPAPPTGCVSMQAGLKERFVNFTAAGTTNNPTLMIAEVLIWLPSSAKPTRWWTMAENLIPAPKTPN